MQYVYVVYDHTDKNHRKPYIHICRNEVKAQEVVDEMRAKVNEYARSLIDYWIEPLL
jgi:hypothetical protein